jgi:hypothetical protein
VTACRAHRFSGFNRCCTSSSRRRAFHRHSLAARPTVQVMRPTDFYLRLDIASAVLFELFWVLEKMIMSVDSRPLYDLSRVMEIPEAAEILQVSQKQINAWIDEGVLELYRTPGFSNQLVLVPSNIPDFRDSQNKRLTSSETVIRTLQPTESAAPSKPELQNLDPSFREAASTLLKTVEQIQGLVRKGAIIVRDGAITPESVAAYRKFLHS